MVLNSSLFCFSWADLIAFAQLFLMVCIFLLLAFNPAIILLTDLISSVNCSSNSFSSSFSSIGLFSRSRSSSEVFPSRAAFQIKKQILSSIQAICLSFFLSTCQNQTIVYTTKTYNLIIQIKMHESLDAQQIQMGVETCQICYETYEFGEVDSQRPSKICYDCWYKHVKTVIMQISYKTGSQIISPFEGKEPIDICVALNALKKVDAEELQQKLFKKYTSFKSDIEKCPSQTCDYVFTIEKCKWGLNQDYSCPKCDAALMKSNTLDIKSFIGLIYFLLIANKCPSCEIPIEKTTGCPHMSCPCGHHFCWYCLKDYFPSANNIYSIHEPKECGAILISKLIFISICLSGIFFTILGNQIFREYMGYFFIGVGYMFQTLIIDLFIVANVVLINNFYLRYRNHYFYNNSGKYYVGILITIDLILIILAYIFFYDLLISSILIILVELCMAGMGYISVLLISTSIQTWFDFII